MLFNPFLPLFPQLGNWWGTGDWLGGWSDEAGVDRSQHSLWFMVILCGVGSECVLGPGAYLAFMRLLSCIFGRFSVRF